MASAIDDVSDGDRMRRELADARGRLRLLSAHTRGILFEFDAAARFVRVWASDPRLLLKPEKVLLGRTLIEALGPDMGSWHHERVCHTLRTGEDQEYDYVLQAPSGARNFACSSVALPAADDARSGAVFWIRDVTEQVELRKKLQRNDVLAAVGGLAAGVAHEVNNPLGYMRLNLEHVSRALGRLRGDPDLAGHLEPLVRPVEMIREGAERVHEIVIGLLDLARAPDPHDAVDVERALELSLEATWSKLGPGTEVERDYRGVPAATGNERRLIQVFTNLLANAGHAMTRVPRSRHVLRLTTRTDAGRVIVDVADTGDGIASEHLSRVFEPFFTTTTEGLGLGLAICQRIVASLSGEIRAESRPGEGTTFTVSLELADQTAAGGRGGA